MFSICRGIFVVIALTLLALALSFTSRVTAVMHQWAYPEFWVAVRVASANVLIFALLFLGLIWVGHKQATTGRLFF